MWCIIPKCSLYNCTATADNFCDNKRVKNEWYLLFLSIIKEDVKHHCSFTFDAFYDRCCHKQLPIYRFKLLRVHLLIQFNTKQSQNIEIFLKAL